VRRGSFASRQCWAVGGSRRVCLTEKDGGRTEEWCMSELDSASYQRNALYPQVMLRVTLFCVVG